MAVLNLVDKNYSTPYGIAVSLPILEGQDSGSGSFDLSRLFIKVAEGNVTAVTLNEGSLSINPETGTLDWFPIGTYEGTVPPVVIVAYNSVDDSGEFSVNITVEQEPDLAVVPIEPLAAPKWWLGSFRTGYLEGFEIPYTSDSISLDIYGEEEADLTVPMMALSDADRLNFDEKFEINEKFIALFDESEKVVFAGYIEKLSPGLIDETMSIKAKGFKSWLKTRFVVNSDTSSIAKSTDTWKITASPRTVAKTVVQAALTGNNNPSSVQYPPSRSGSYRAEYVLSELSTVASAIDAISMDQLGAEIKFIPKKVDNRIVWELVAGNPHINDHGNADIVLNLEDPNMIAVGFDKIIDGTDSFNRVWLESPYADQKDAEINLTAKTAISSNKLIREVKEKFDVEMTASEIQEQWNARFEDANKENSENTVVIFDDAYSFYGSVGRRLHLVGAGKSAGLDEIVRIVGVKFTTTERTVELVVENIKRVYPMLPKNASDKAKKDAKEQIKNEMKWNSKLNQTSTGATGGGNPWNPGEGTGGEMTDKDLWGSEGQPADGSAPTTVNNGIISNVFSEQQLFTPNDTGPAALESKGGNGLDVPFCQNEGNRVFILTKSGVGSGSTDIPVAEQVKVPIEFGVPVNAMDFITDAMVGEIWVRKTFVQAGNIGNIDFAGKVPMDIIKQKLAEANATLTVSKPDNYYYTISDPYVYVHKQRIEMAPFVSNGRLYVYLNIRFLANVHAKYTPTDGSAPFESSVLYDHEIKGMNMFVSTQINQDGTLSNLWVDSEKPPNNERVFWKSSYRYGSVFGYMSSIPQSDRLQDGSFYYAQTPRIRGILGQWFSLPAIENPTTKGTAFDIRAVSYNGFLYASPTYTYYTEVEGVNKIRVHADGTTPSESWITVAQGQNTKDMRNMTVCRGYLIFTGAGGFAYAKILPSGDLEEIKIATAGATLGTNAISYGGYVVSLAFAGNSISMNSFRVSEAPVPAP